MDFDAIFGDKAPETPEPKPAETPTTPPIEAQPEPQQEPVEQPTPVTPPAAPETDRNVPLTSLLDERDKRKAAERRLADLEAAQQQQRQPAARPDPYDDPDGYDAAIEKRIADRALATKFELSEVMARDKHGDELVAKAMEWGAERAQANPGFRDDFLKAPNPIDWVVRQQKRDGLLSEVGEDPDAYVRRRAAELGLIAAPDAGTPVVDAPVQQQAPKPAVPTRSIANAPSQGGGNRDVPTGLDAAMETVFGK